MARTSKVVKTTPKRRSKKGTAPKGKQGKPSWVTGIKLAFFERYKDAWDLSGDDPGTFYKEMAMRFILKYGWDPLFAERGHDLEVDNDDPTEDELDAFESPPDEDDQRHKHFNNLRAKIGEWYRYHYRKLLASATLQANVNALIEGVSGYTKEKPRRRRVTHVYSRRHFDTRIQPYFDPEWKQVQAEWAAGELEIEPKYIQVYNRVKEEVYKREPKEFRDRLEAEVEKMNDEALEEWEAGKRVYNLSAGGLDSRTPREFHELISNMAGTLEPLADSLSKLYGMPVSIFVAGPIPEKGGQIQVMSANAGKTRGRAPKKWHEFDGPGFSGVVTSMERFATVAFTQEQCDARSLPGVALASASRTWVSNGAASASGSGLTSGIFGGVGTRARREEDDSNEEEEEDEEDEEDEEQEQEPQPRTRKVQGKGKAKASTVKGTGKEGVRKERRRKRAVAASQRNGTSGSQSQMEHRAPPAPRAAYRGAAGYVAPTSTSKPASPSTPASTTTPAPTSPALPTPESPSRSLGSLAAAAAAAAAEETTGAAADGASGWGNTAPQDASSSGGAVSPTRQPSPSKEKSAPPAWRNVGQSRWQDELKRLWPWFEEVGAGWGEVWEDCAWAFLSFEEASGFPFERLRMAKGPREGLGVDAWIATGRKLWSPCLPDTNELWPRFWKWWRGLQPEERRTEDGVLTRTVGLDWGCIRDLSGKNGLLQVIMVLAWWGIKAHAVDGTAEQVAEWVSATEDVCWALEEMVKEGKLSKKRAAERGVSDKDAPAPKLFKKRA
ncbi:hypothetical protein C8R43DRAFT_1127226 [Mycena crocata]|nr:hypothetical protein C8R43DRAFT_1127226 [Mycena crocata]